MHGHVRSIITYRRAITLWGRSTLKKAQPFSFLLLCGKVEVTVFSDSCYTYGEES